MKVPPGSVQICQPYKFKALRVQTKTRSKISMNIYAEAFLTILRENQKEASGVKEERMMFFGETTKMIRQDEDGGVTRQSIDYRPAQRFAFGV